jgi:uncharacterized protein
MMHQVLTEKISVSEIKKLGHILDEKFNMTLTELHGFFTAVLSSPVLVKPSQWLQYIFEDEEGNQYCFENVEEFQEINELILKFYNSIISQFNKGGDYKIASFNKGKYIKISDASEEELEYWCSSYISGSYCGKWANDEAIAMLLPFAVLAKKFDIDKPEKKAPEDPIAIKNQFKQELSNYIYMLYDHNNEERLTNSNKFKDFDQIKPSNTTKIGRNDFCPCGSGKKYKKCCINSPIEYH